VIALGTLPSAIRWNVQTGDSYLLTRQFIEDMFARLSGTGLLRFNFQPAVANLLGLLDGLRDARKVPPSYPWVLALHREHRRDLLRTTLAPVRELVAVTVLLDIISQFLIFREIYPGAAILLGPVLIGVPRAVSRALAIPVAKGKVYRATSTHDH
jgi:hypothetical protein